MKDFNQVEWDKYVKAMEVGAKALRERLPPEDLEKAFHCSLCTQRAIANLCPAPNDHHG